jgi:hypothetical protein
MAGPKFTKQMTVAQFDRSDNRAGSTAGIASEMDASSVQ